MWSVTYLPNPGFSWIAAISAVERGLAEMVRGMDVVDMG